MKRKLLRKQACQCLNHYMDILKNRTYPNLRYIGIRAVAASDAFLCLGLITGEEHEFYEFCVRMLTGLETGYKEFMEGRHE